MYKKDCSIDYANFRSDSTSCIAGSGSGSIWSNTVDGKYSYFGVICIGK